MCLYRATGFAFHMLHAKLQDRWTALISAANFGHTECVSLLLKDGANKDVKAKVRNMEYFLILIFLPDVFSNMPPTS